MKVLTVVGNRPQFVKAAAVSPLLRREHEEILAHTGQHHDDHLSGVFFRELGLPRPDVQLAVAGGSNTSQLSRMLAALEPIVAEATPDAVLVYGDTNSTLAGALVASDRGVPVAHVEAGMRSFDPKMPEERNRVLTDNLSSLLLCPTPVAAQNLERERVSGRIERTGDVMADVVLAMAPVAEQRSTVVADLGVEPGFVLVTAHRAANVDHPRRLAALVDLLVALPGPVVFPVHPRTQARLEASGLRQRLDATPGLRTTPPVGYLDLLALATAARAVVTDSGGLQKEAYLLRTPCITLRDRTEWTETVDAGWNTLVDLDATAALRALERPTPDEHPDLYGAGCAGAQVVAALSAVS